MKIAIRADSSLALGSGHIMRCVTLARILVSFGYEIHFISLNLKGNMADFLKSYGFHVHLLQSNIVKDSLSIQQLIDAIKQTIQNDAEQTTDLLKKHGPFEWIIVDHYSLDVTWENIVSECVERIFVIDDLANRIHNCDVLLDQNFHLNPLDRYEGKIPRKCVALLGTKYMLFRSEFLNIKPRVRNGEIKRLLIFFGGSDLTNETSKTLKALLILKRENLYIDVVLGASNPHTQEIYDLCRKIPDTKIHVQIDYMAQLMNDADLAIGAGGASTWERCLLGLPALIIVLAENQRISIEELENKEVFVNLGSHEDVDENLIFYEIDRLMNEPYLVETMGRNALELVPHNDLFDIKDWKNIF